MGKFLFKGEPREHFLPFAGTREEFLQDPVFQKIVKDYGYVVVRYGVTHCETDKTTEEMKCERGVTLTTFKSRPCDSPD